MWRLAVYILLGFHRPTSICIPAGHGWGFRGERRGCGLLLQEEKSWCWRSPRPTLLVQSQKRGASSSSPLAHLAAPRMLIWKENKNVFISQERRRTRVKTQRGVLGPHTACCWAEMVKGFSYFFVSLLIIFSPHLVFVFIPLI